MGKYQVGSILIRIIVVLLRREQDVSIGQLVGHCMENKECYPGEGIWFYN